MGILRHTKKRNERGSVILFAVIGIAVVSALAMIYAKSYTSVRRAQGKLNLLNFVSELQLTLRNTVNDTQSWSVTIADGTHNPSMQCLITHTCATPVGPTSFTLWPAGVAGYGALAKSVYDGTDPAAGFTLDGTRCSGFSPTGNTACPIHVNLQWATPGCGPGPCSAPVFVQADVLFRPGGTFSSFGTLDESKLTLTFLQILSGYAKSCSGDPDPTVTAACAAPLYAPEKIYCTGNGWQCGQIFF